MTDELNPIRLEIIRNALVAAAEEMSVAIRRTARSMMVREGRDFSTAIFDVTGRNVAQAALIPIHLNTMAPCLEEVLARFMPVDRWEDGDVVIVNDPYCGGQHLPDVTTFRPIFDGGELIGFTGVMSHHTDIGGGVAGSYNMRATEIFAEGLRIPPIKIYRKGVLTEEVLSIILQNVREPDIFRGDLMSQIGALEIGCRSIAALAGKYGRSFLLRAANQILSQSEQAMRQAIAAIPDGVYAFEDVVDDEANPERMHRLAVKLTVADDHVTVDFTGSADQVESPTNCTLNIARSCIYYAVMTGVADHIPPNSGCYAAIDVIAPKGSIVNCNFPAPVVNRIQVGHRIVNVILGALSKAIPQRIPAAPYGVTYVYALEAVFADGRRKIFFDSEVGGWGAEPNKDGPSGFAAGLHNVANVPIEVHEATSPITFVQSAFRTDSGGAGKYRGGLGMVREWRLDAPRGTLTATLNRIRSRPYGLAGGEPGSVGRLTLIRSNGEAVPLTGAIDRVPVSRGDSIRLETSGGGGFGLASERDPAARQTDIDNGFVTDDAAPMGHAAE